MNWKHWRYHLERWKYLFHPGWKLSVFSLRWKVHACQKNLTTRHMLQLSRFDREAPVLRRQLQSSRPPVSSWNLRLWDDLSLNVRPLWTFQVDHTFYRFSVKILVASNKIRYACCSQLPYSSWTVDPCQLKHKLFWYKRKKRHERVWESMQFVIFKPWKVLWTWIGYWWNSYCCFTLIFGKVFAKATQNSAF